jgi:phthalate 4,5-dioxygenase oxygenase subunit
MLSREENELLTRTGPGTVMGEAMRRYWIPALLAREIAEPDGPPVRVRLLGEDLVAFRDSDGRIGLLDEYCPHRRASLWFGRNKAHGLRCVYHGWKFAVDGSCVTQMNEPEENQFKHKVRLTAYPTCELGGLVWAYMGPPEKIPPLPKFAWTQAPETHRHVSKVIQECNWLQGLEGGLDTSHAPILHRLLKDNAGRGGIKAVKPLCTRRGPATRRRHHRLRLSVHRHPPTGRCPNARAHLPLHPALPPNSRRLERCRRLGRCRARLGSGR